MLAFDFSTDSASKPRIPRALFLRIKNAVLGSGYELSVAFVGSRAIAKLNRRYRGISSSTDILSFPLSAQTGEMLFSIADVRRRAPLFGYPPGVFLVVLFIHGLLHLKGYSHGSRMETQERKFRRRFNI